MQSEFILSEEEVRQVAHEQRRRGGQTAKGNRVAYLGGQVPMAWLVRALKISRCAVHVGLILWHLRAFSAEIVVRRKHFTKFQLAHSSYHKGLCELEQAGLIKVSRARGRIARVHIVSKFHSAG